LLEAGCANSSDEWEGIKLSAYGEAGGEEYSRLMLFSAGSYMA
jgi:hypothetical protein